MSTTFSPLKRMIWVKHVTAGLTAPEYSVLSALFFHSDAEGRCYPSQKTLADFTHLSERCVRSALRDLAAKEVIVRRRRITREGRTSDEVTLNIGVVATNADESQPASGAGTQPAPPSDTQPAPDCRLPNRHQVPGKVDTSPTPSAEAPKIRAREEVGNAVGGRSLRVVASS